MRSPVKQRWDVLRSEWARGLFDRDLRVLVLAAHPDDETIGASILLARCNQPKVVYLTDGAPRNAKLWPPEFHGSREEYARFRCVEAETALAHCGISPQQIEWLGGLDQEAIVEVASLVEQLTKVAVNYKPNVLVTHSYEGGHPDHDAAALIASLALSRFSHDCLLLEMTSYHVSDRHWVTGEFLNADSLSECMFELSAEDRARKQAMFNAYASQKLVLSSFSFDCERLRPAPAYDFAAPPHEERLWYEILGWEMTGKCWRTLAAQALHSTEDTHAAHRA